MPGKKLQLFLRGLEGKTTVFRIDEVSACYMSAHCWAYRLFASKRKKPLCNQFNFIWLIQVKTSQVKSSQTYFKSVMYITFITQAPRIFFHRPTNMHKISQYIYLLN